MDVLFRITLKQQLAQLNYAWVKYGIFLGVYFYLFRLIFQPLFLVVIGCFALIDLLPAIILHIQYYRKNKNSNLIVNKDNRNISYSENEGTTTFQFEDISYLKCVVGYGDERGAPGWYSFGTYKYCKLGIKNRDEDIILTSLMIPNIEQTLELLIGIKPERVAKALPML